jgi:hypothetical protein
MGDPNPPEFGVPQSANPFLDAAPPAPLTFQGARRRDFPFRLQA